ncbi:MAG: tetrahydromethanopterin S-methyltransferase subunit D [Candidatus Methanoperedens nitroreducens]|uniref:Tetrahydromethanopterin S-methyltransferase subunit D n=1 Tax=Candidatus Methanoperedens nitratireducens TaxID=1392998 RepID=A0A0P8A8Z0_9EURY|nr:tetrahydromethanopterin S-methyltransferase subunit D [Candidatus Methanoperedens sp. BLZ2]KAB2948020.1 MAG: tetrahydromethanopterin S-methyltransferase subunit D [Candidatus Methanoperedens sp.]KPQ43083.1 MAG: tetrahydromethanopterin S-methyltransferase subunit D [Candidatus Methanoperedens sp. BLZ1]MBZ0176362.1 tetrahydromethanopterin S-methyltransferase subunit D [Candidatus Methanoperedens nitroreducens]CAG0989986.1 tetrahydromethanopterin S-methyltransferase subunit D [Methanosarcinales
MVDILLLDQTTLINILLIAISGTLICIGVHFVPVGGAPAAMAQATGIGTGTVELAAGSGLVGLITAAYMYANVENAPMALVLAAGAVGSMIMISSAMIAASLIYAYGVGVPFASAQVKKDPITRDSQDIYMSKGTQGQGVPTVCFVSGVIGAALGGIGGALIYYVLVGIYGQLISATSAAAVAGVFTLGVFYVNAVVPSYGVGGTIEGFHDPKFRRVLPKDAFTSFIVSLVLGVVAIVIAMGM